jgi:hypothetical protein
MEVDEPAMTWTWPGIVVPVWDCGGVFPVIGFSFREVIAGDLFSTFHGGGGRNITNYRCATGPQCGVDIVCSNVVVL